jgi:hypothetical protein
MLRDFLGVLRPLEELGKGKSSKDLCEIARTLSQKIDLTHADIQDYWVQYLPDLTIDSVSTLWHGTIESTWDCHRELVAAVCSFWFRSFNPLFCPLFQFSFPTFALISLCFLLSLPLSLLVEFCFSLPCALLSAILSALFSGLYSALLYFRSPFRHASRSLFCSRILLSIRSHSGLISALLFRPAFISALYSALLFCSPSHFILLSYYALLCALLSTLFSALFPSLSRSLFRSPSLSPSLSLFRFSFRYNSSALISHFPFGSPFGSSFRHPIALHTALLSTLFFALIFALLLVKNFAIFSLSNYRSPLTP